MKLKIFILLWFFSCKIFAQKSLSLDFGGNQLTIRDGTFSPLLYSGFGFETALKYKNEELNHVGTLAIKYGSGNLKNNFGNTASQFNAELYYRYFRKIRQNSHWFLGGISSTKVAIRNYNVPFGGESMSGDIFSTLNIATRYQTKNYHWGKVSAELDIPVVGVAFARKFFNLSTHPELIVYDNITNDVIKTAELISFPQLKAMNLSFIYEYPISEKVVFAADLTFNLYEYERLQNTTNSVNSALKFGVICLLNSKK
jgi:hypothetical protein